MTETESSFLQLDQLLDNLQVEQLDTCLFRGFTKARRVPRVFGGQVLGQAVNAASRTVTDERRVHSLHSYFLRPGNPDRAIIYDVDPIRDGGSFTTRRVVAKQDGKAIFNASLSFHKVERGFDHQMEMPEGVPQPETLRTELDYWKSRPKNNVLESNVLESNVLESKVLENKVLENNVSSCPPDLGQYQAVELRVIAHRDPDCPQPLAPVHGLWVKANGELGSDPSVHRVLLAYISDMQFMATSLRPHPVTLTTPGFQGASLDHTMWFHCDFRVDEWLYYHMDSPRAAGARGFNRGSFYTRAGLLVASAAQEGLIRYKTPTP